MRQRARSVPGAHRVAAICCRLLACCSRTPPVDYRPACSLVLLAATRGACALLAGDEITPDNVTDLKRRTHPHREASLGARAPDQSELRCRHARPGTLRPKCGAAGSEATPIRRGRLHLCSSMTRRRAGSGKRARAVVVRSAARYHRRGAAVPRRQLLPRRERCRWDGLRQPHLHRHAGRAPHCARCERWQAVRGLRYRRHGGPAGKPRAHAPGRSRA